MGVQSEDAVLYDAPQRPRPSPTGDRLRDALLCLPIDTTPIWIMRQAGRYLPEYRKTRARAGDFLTLCNTPELACEVTLQPLARFPLDAAIIFSDILLVPQAMGMELVFRENEGPSFPRPLDGEKAVAALRKIEPERDLAPVLEALRLTRRELDGKTPLIGFCGSPWTLAVYMVEGSTGHQFTRIKAMLLDRPDLLRRLLDALADAVAAHLNAQIRAGAQCVMLFDTWGGVLPADKYREFSLGPMSKILRQLTLEHDGQPVPNIVFTKGGGMWLEDIARTGCDAIGLDWTIDIGAARRQIINYPVALQGNLDPAALHASEKAIRAEARRIIETHRHASATSAGHVFNLGHGIDPKVDPGKVAVLVDAVHELGAEARKQMQI